MTRIRYLSPLENSFLAFDTDSYSSMCNQYVIEGLGGFSALAWKSAIELATSSNPGVALKLKGSWFLKSWHSDGMLPSLIFHSDHWNGENSEGAFFDGKKIDSRYGPSAEIILVEGDYPKIIFRTHHALMDGNATLFWIQEVFRALREEKLSGSQHDENESKLRRQFQAVDKPVSNIYHNWSPVFKSSYQQRNQQNISSNCVWLNKQYKQIPERALAKFIAYIYSIRADSAKAFSVRVPSDLRRLLPDGSQYLLTNCVAALDFIFDSQIDELSLHKQLMKELFKKQDLNVFPKNYEVGRFIPSSRFKMTDERMQTLCAQQSCDLSAIVTHMGKVSLKQFSDEFFLAKNIYAIPAPLEGVSLSCVMIEHDDGLSVTLSSPKHYANLDKLESFAKDLTKVFSV